ncbi:interferon-induced GTP-binding protein Mx2 [Apiospora phragmitis]|uniref:Interferon-induced GTP-binding protein Mx2 n=1 Tax=Apiospora phragmitis TaxID=2905665 RepID=A0ABR1SVT1_9PEZI
MAACEIGLGNQAILTKIDQLRELNVGTIIPLPQLVVVGDQSSGKSSVLESLTGFSFPRAAGLCTRYATQITCRREPERGVAQLLQFKREIPELNNDDLTKIFEEANNVMGIRMSTTGQEDGRTAFSQDILKIEISGPDVRSSLAPIRLRLTFSLQQDHLTVIDVPGIFRLASPGLTTESDIVLVENMVKSYMSDRRTIILAIMPCNVDVATQEILKLAEVADPCGVRTMGVLTKPDLATEKATRDAVVDLVLGRRSALKLGYHIVKNRSADDHSSTSSERLAAEKAFFTASPWSSVADRCGTTSLKARLQELLMSISKQEMPYVKKDAEQRLLECRNQLDAMGPCRADQTSQRLFMVKLASNFQAITQGALNGYYAGDKVFQMEPNLKLATKIMKLNEVFANVFWKRGHQHHFRSEQNDDGETLFGRAAADLPFAIPILQYPELGDIIDTEDYQCPKPLKGPITARIEEVFESSRGPELGTFGGTILAAIFQEQSEKWEPLVLSHTSRAIALVHDYIFQLLTKLCPENQVKENLWNILIVDKLRDAYRRAMDHARFLLAIERGGRPSTFNHYFNSNLQKQRSNRMCEALKTMAVCFTGNSNEYVPVSKISQYADNKANGEQVCEDILDTLVSYYQVSRKRFVDTICQQVVLHFLLEGEKSPLKIMGPDLVMSLDLEQLESIAGEDVDSKRQRQVLMWEIRSLEAAIKVLRA